VLSAPQQGAESDIKIDAIAYQRPVSLDFGGLGAFFEGVAGTWRYQLRNVPAGGALYDVTDPLAPVRLALSNDAQPIFQDGPAPRRYLVSGPGTLDAPEIVARAATTLAEMPGAHAPLVLYIAPAAYQAALTPLVALRQHQGYSAQVIDVQTIYDHWNFGRVAPEAIRNFLRWTAANWNPAPLAVVLVGDGTYDPLNYTRHNNLNVIPPYMAMVDPWVARGAMAEAACDACYVLLDGADPTTDDQPDMAIGRLTVNNPAELANIVAKTLAYEASAGGIDWRSRALFLADNGYLLPPEAPLGTPDNAGDFAAQADAGANLLAAGGFQLRRVYFDPWQKTADSRPITGQPWRVADPLDAHRQALDALDAGAGLMVYVGHGNQFQLAVTSLAADPSYLVGLYDADQPDNGAFSVALEMTCLTSAFAIPSFSGTSIDERLLLNPNGGSVAVWGPTGLGVSTGHDALLRGFLKALIAKPPGTPRLWELTAAGQLELRSSEYQYHDLVHTFVLLGDPLTRVWMQPARHVALPIARH
jgi:hypothetical protein